MNTKDRTYNPSKGAVTFLDVLGWKGIYQKNKNAVNALTKLIEEIKKHADKYTADATNENNRLRGIKTQVLSISDTIAIFTHGDPEDTILIHAKICSEIIPKSLERKIPIRGAISYGEYSIHDNIMIGPAVDEAASWHESTDWIGVSLTPTAQIYCGDSYKLPIMYYKNIPYKRPMKNLNTCVQWKFDDIELLRNIIIDMGAQTQDIASKYLNTLEFIKTN
ncbi:MAG: hypothetical protein ACRCXT_14680 [Paraclostridium sp.]